MLYIVFTVPKEKSLRFASFSERLRTFYFSSCSVVNASKNIKGIFSFVDSFVYLAACLSQRFCSSIVSTKAINKMENKILTRNVLKDLSISLNYSVYRPTKSLSDFLKETKNLKFPLVVKSPCPST